MLKQMFLNFFLMEKVLFLLFCLLEEGCKNYENSGKFPFIGSNAAYRLNRARAVFQGESLY